jgi:hypothetical protein
MMLTPQPAEASCSKDAAKCYLASMVNRPLELTKLVNHLPDTLVSDDECEGGWLQKKKKGFDSNLNWCCSIADEILTRRRHY